MDSKWKLKKDDPVSANNTVQMWRLNYCDNMKTSKKKIIYNILSFFMQLFLILPRPPVVIEYVCLAV